MSVPAGAYMNSLDESDLQFYATYVQPVVIAEDSVQAGLAKSSLTIPHSNPSEFETWASRAPNVATFFNNPLSDGLMLIPT